MRSSAGSERPVDSIHADGDVKYFAYSPDAFSLTEFMSPEECSAFIELGETLGFDDAPISTASAQVLMSEVRNNSRAMVDDPDLAYDLWRRIKEYVPQEIGGWRPIGLNERFRFYRYDQHQIFRWHRDGRFARNDREGSRYTLMVYLNDDFEGGFTDFRSFKVYPVQGMALCFLHPLLHEGATVTSGRKYVLRTDVMYRVAESS